MYFISAESRIGGFVPLSRECSLQTENVQFELFLVQTVSKQTPQRKIVWGLYHQASDPEIKHIDFAWRVILVMVSVLAGTQSFC